MGLIVFGTSTSVFLGCGLLRVGVVGSSSYGEGLAFGWLKLELGGHSLYGRRLSGQEILAT